MTTKSKSKSKTKKPSVKKTATVMATATTTDNTEFAALLASVRAATSSASDRRKELLAQVAGSIAASLVAAPTPDIASPSGIATAAVDIAEAILKKVGILPEASTEIETEIETETATSSASSSNDEDRYAKIRDFLMTEWSRKDNRQLVGVDLLYAPGQGYRDETLRSWERADEPEFFATDENVENLVSTIIALATSEADVKSPGKHRFIVRTRQHMGARPTLSFALYPSAFGAAS